MNRTQDPYAAFRPNLEQQRKRAKELRDAVRAGDESARERIAKAAAGHLPAGPTFKLTDAQFVVARELGLASWRHLRTHIAALGAARAAIDSARPAPDEQPRTLHVRCGSDIQHELSRAGFAGEFLSLWDPFVVGPVHRGPDWIERRAAFLAAAHGGGIDVPFETLLAELSEADARLSASAAEYDRVVIWMEHDSHDQLSLIRILAQYARARPPQTLELVSINHFPGSRRFIGLGQLPPEALRMLWRRRQPVDAEALQFATDAWEALTADDPRALAALARIGTPSLPDLAPALRRHLQELPSLVNGLSLTEALTLQMLSEQSMTIGQLFGTLHAEREPLPFLGDTLYLHIVNQMGRAATPVFDRDPGEPAKPFSDRLEITPTGRSVLSGAIDWLSLQPPVRWWGGVRIDPSSPAWRWDPARQEVVRAPAR
jgi:hypothetical protein